MNDIWIHSYHMPPLIVKGSKMTKLDRLKIKRLMKSLKNRSASTTIFMKKDTEREILPKQKDENLYLDELRCEI